MANLYFNSNNIGAIAGVDLYNFDVHQLPERDIKINKVARRDLSIITSSEWTQKEIPAYMDICSGTRAETEDTVQYVKSLLQPQNGKLELEMGGDVVSWTATMNEFQTEWVGNKAYVEVTFLASDPLGRKSLVSGATGTAVTTSTWESNMTIEGSATALPIITVLFNAVTGGTSKSVTIRNAKTTQGMTINRTWLAGDELVINSDALTVTVNGTAVDFTGMFPQFPVGNQQVTYLDTLTTRNVNISLSYNPKTI